MKLHYIIDEELSGKQTKVEREYVEVDREADVGDYFVSLDELGGITYGTIYRVDSLTEGKIHGHKGRHFFDDEGRWRAVWSPHKYKTLEPTEYVRVTDLTTEDSEPKRYKLADRRAEVGEKILVVEYEGIVVTAHRGDVLTVIEASDECITTDGKSTFFNDNTYKDKYYVLEPLEDDTPKSTEDLVASLAAEVAKLKREVEGLTRLTDTHQSTIMQLLDHTDSNHKDIVKQAEEFADFKHSPSEWAEQSDVIELNKRVSALESNVEASGKIVEVYVGGRKFNSVGVFPPKI